MMGVDPVAPPSMSASEGGAAPAAASSLSPPCSTDDVAASGVMAGSSSSMDIADGETVVKDEVVAPVSDVEMAEAAGEDAGSPPPPSPLSLPLSPLYIPFRISYLPSTAAAYDAASTRADSTVNT